MTCKDQSIITCRHEPGKVVDPKPRYRVLTYPVFFLSIVIFSEHYQVAPSLPNVTDGCIDIMIYI